MKLYPPTEPTPSDDTELARKLVAHADGEGGRFMKLTPSERCPICRAAAASSVASSRSRSRGWSETAEKWVHIIADRIVGDDDLRSLMKVDDGPEAPAAARLLFLAGYLTGRVREELGVWIAVEDALAAVRKAFAARAARPCDLSHGGPSTGRPRTG